MTANINTKLIVTAIAITSLGLAGTAQAQAPEQAIAIGEPTPGKPVPAQPQPATPPNGGPAVDPAPAGQAGEEAEEVDYTSPAYFESQAAKSRFDRYCNMKDAEPSHSDKKFCEDYRRHAGMTSPSPTTATKPAATKPAATDHSTTGATPRPREAQEGPEQAEAQVERASEASLPFTGIEVWQLALLGAALSGGGFAARRLLTA